MPVVALSSAVVTATSHKSIPAGLTVAATEVDLLVVGSGTGLAAALAAHEQGLSVLVVEKSSYVGGSTARSGGALWLPASPVIEDCGGNDPVSRAHTYLESVVGNSAPPERSAAYLDNLPATVEMLRRTTPMKLFWAKEYSDYHPEAPGGSAAAARANAGRSTPRFWANICLTCDRGSWRSAFRCRPPAPTTAG